MEEAACGFSRHLVIVVLAIPVLPSTIPALLPPSQFIVIVGIVRVVVMRLRLVCGECEWAVTGANGRERARIVGDKHESSGTGANRRERTRMGTNQRELK